MSNISYKFKQLNTAEQLIVINIIVFILQSLVSFLTGIRSIQIVLWLGLSNHLSVVISHFWSLLTYAFLHHNFSHIFWNMLLLYFVGTIFFNLFKKELFYKVYLLGTLGGSISFLIGTYFLESENVFLIGASASVMALLIFVCTYAPNYQIILPFNIRLRLSIFGLIIVLLSSLQIGKAMPGGSIAHLGGALVGFMYALQIKGIFKYNLKFPRKKNVKPKRNPSTRKKYINQEHQQKIDSILDKISKSGYESLSKSEKEFLFKAKDES